MDISNNRRVEVYSYYENMKTHKLEHIINILRFNDLIWRIDIF
jgi:hypothetical protein